ncbi:MAG: hypothetical protein Kow0077_15330 [Anaerolineae bacterium]
MSMMDTWKHPGTLVLSLIFVLGIVLAMQVSAQVAHAQSGGDPTPTPFFTTVDDPALSARMDFVEQATSILRDLPPKAPVTRAFLTREELLAFLQDRLDEEYPPEEARDDAIFYHAFDFMPLETDLRQLQLAVMQEQIAGFYDSELEAMFVISSAAELNAMNQVLYAHEFTHVLQDQHFDLDALVGDEDASAENPDAILAKLALVEGDAMLMTEGYQAWMLRKSPGMAFDMVVDALMIQSDELQAAPAILQSELLFPYLQGRDFTYTFFATSGGWEGVNALYAAPPESTEQVLHIDRYLSGDLPVAVTLPDLDGVLGGDWRLVWDRPLGEFYTREHLRQQLEREIADVAAAGWGGDRYRLYHDDARGLSVLVWKTVWDTTADAAEFLAAYHNYAARFYDAPGYPVDERTVCWYGEDVRCLRRGTREALVIRAPERVFVDAVLEAAGPVR